MKETSILKLVQMAMSTIGARALRNNVGVLQDRSTGRHVKFGLCVGSSDLIGWVPVRVTEKMVGSTVAVFLAIETKVPGKNPEPFSAQEHFIKAVNGAGGIAIVAHSQEEAVTSVKAGVSALQGETPHADPSGF